MQAEHYNGLIAVWKEQGYTSHDVVAKLRGILHQKKIGHTGTLDPQAKGVLAVGLGLGTKTFDLVPDHWKTYEAEVTFGVQTDTEDIWGNVLKTHRHVVVDLIFLEKCIKYLTCRTDLTLYIIDITKNRITYMVINHYTLLCTVKKFFSCTNTV